jgi:N,N'-diacetyllegionaminate synthase
MKRKTIVIAEIGENHMGDMDLAKKMIEEAAKAGADIIKFQSYTPKTFKEDDPEYEWFKKVPLTDAAHFMLKEYTEEKGSEFMSSPFDMERARFLCEELKLRKIKVASGKMADVNMLSYLNHNCEEIFLSTGMANLKEIKDSLRVLDKVKVNLLHCVTQYPVKNADANLLAIRTLKHEFPELTVGYSDHTIGTLAPLVAVALGAEVIEKHFTLDKSLQGTDHILSVTPDELRKLIQDIRELRLLLGDGRKVPRRCEEHIKEFVRARFL